LSFEVELLEQIALLHLPSHPTQHIHDLVLQIDSLLAGDLICNENSCGHKVLVDLTARLLHMLKADPSARYGRFLDVGLAGALRADSEIRPPDREEQGQLKGIHG
jgi:hypothetical protein